MEPLGPEWLINPVGIFQRDLVQLIHRDEHLGGGLVVAAGRAVQCQLALDEKLFHQREQGLGIKSANVAVPDDLGQHMRSVGDRGQSRDDVAESSWSRLRAASIDFIMPHWQASRTTSASIQPPAQRALKTALPAALTGPVGSSARKNRYPSAPRRLASAPASPTRAMESVKSSTAKRYASAPGSRSDPRGRTPRSSACGVRRT